MIEQQVIVQWYTPDEKLPNEGDIVVATISGQAGCIYYDHALALVEYYKEDGWYMTDKDDEMDELTVHAWCDLEPYKGGK